MRLIKWYFSLVLLSILVISCKKDRNSTNETPTIVATEEWEYIIDSDSSNYGHEIYEKKSDGSISVKGSWHYYETECPFQEGIMTINDTNISYTVYGVATYQSNPTDTSHFTLNVIGRAHNGKSSWSGHINFKTWKEEYQGSGYGIRKSGSGVTN